LTEIGNNLQRVRELSVQASNATNSASDRKALQAEVTQLVSEIDRVAKQSDFNGTKLLDGSFSSQLFQVGANAGQAIAIDKTIDAKANALGGAQFASGKVAITAAASATADIALTGLSITDSKGAKVDFADLTVKSAGSVAGTNTAAATALAAHINAKIGETGVLAEVDAAGTGLTLSSVKDSVDKDGAYKGFTVAATGAAYTDDVTAPAAPAKKFADKIDVSTVKGAQQAMEVVDKALGAINSTRADLGAVQNRFTSVVANLQTSSENLSASRSRIKDTDFAKETAELTRTQILQQAGTAMLAQANQVPQGVLSLLR
ncbi:flagellin, partial [Stenotrophomonas maltophilia]